VVACVSETAKVYVARVFWGSRLDEFGRDGFVSHAIAVPREAFRRGLHFSAIERALEAYWRAQERKHQENREVPSVPIGSIPEFELEWSDGDESDIGRLRQLVPKREQVDKIVAAFSGKAIPKALILLEGDFHDRIAATYAFASVLIDSGAANFRATSECPQIGILDWYANIVVSSHLPSLGPSSGWLVINPKARVGKFPAIDAGTAKGKLDELYR
jgi:hypothetical protein